MIQTNLRAAVYCRYSSDNQTYSSIEAQLFAIEQYCKNNNIPLIRITSSQYANLNIKDLVRKE